MEQKGYSYYNRHPCNNGDFLVMPNLKKLCDKIISECIETLSMSTAVVSQIKHGTYELVAVKSDCYSFFPGDAFPLSQSSCCQRVISNGNTIGLTELRACPTDCMHPLYEGLPLETYIGTPIYKNDQIWGTLNLSSMLKRPHPFTLEEIRFIEEQAKQISRELSSKHQPQTGATEEPLHN